MPWVLTRGERGGAEIGYRVAGFISERWPASNRNGGRHRLGTGGRHASESAHAGGLSWQKSRTWCETGVVMRTRKPGVVRVSDPDAMAKKSYAGKIGWH